MAGGLIVLAIGHFTGLNGVRSSAAGRSGPTSTTRPSSSSGQYDDQDDGGSSEQSGSDPTTTSSTSTTTTRPATTQAATTSPPTEPPASPPPSVAYLSEMDPLEHDHLPKAGSRKIRGDVYSKSRIITLCQAQGHPPHEETYLVPAGSNWFDVTIGLGDDTPPDERAQVEITLDGRSIFSELLEPGEVYPLHEAVGGVYQLMISAVHVDPSGGVCSVHPVYDVVFGNAQLAE